MTRSILRLRKIVCLLGVLLFLVNLSFAVPVEESSKTVFVPEEMANVESEFHLVAVMGKPSGRLLDSQDPDRIALLQTGIPRGFLKFLRNFLKPEYLPTESFVRENLMFARGVDLSRPEGPNKVGDATYLLFRCEGRDFLVVQTYDDIDGLIGISVSMTPDELVGLDQQAKIRASVEAVLNTYLLPDPMAPHALTVQQSKRLNVGLVDAKPREGKVTNYRQALRGAYSAEGVCLVFPKFRYYPEYKDTLSSWSPPADKYFDFMLGRYHAPRGNKK